MLLLGCTTLARRRRALPQHSGRAHTRRLAEVTPATYLVLTPEPSDQLYHDHVVVRCLLLVRGSRLHDVDGRSFEGRKAPAHEASVATAVCDADADDRQVPKPGSGIYKDHRTLTACAEITSK